ncbi:alpha/beta fold hydrolase [Nocardia sp. NPDC003345]
MTGDRLPPHAGQAATLRRRGGFFLTGDRDAATGKRIGPAWVQWEAPTENHAENLPVILVHGGGGQSTDWLWAVDGGPGWAELFVAAGHPTYLLDRPGHGRSPWDPDTIGGRNPAPDAATVRSLFQFATRPDDDAGLCSIIASSTGLLQDAARSQSMDAARLSELLELTGPAVVVAHSAGSPGTWLAVDRNPHLVRAVVAVEPLGPPFGRPRHARALSRGVTAFPLSSAPRGTAGEPQGLARVPVLVVSADASGHTPADSATAEFLAGLGVEVRHMELRNYGLRGDGHGVVFDKNSTAAFRLVHRWCADATALSGTGPTPTTNGPARQ